MCEGKKTLLMDAVKTSRVVTAQCPCNFFLICVNVCVCCVACTCVRVCENLCWSVYCMYVISNCCDSTMSLPVSFCVLINVCVTLQYVRVFVCLSLLGCMCVQYDSVSSGVTSWCLGVFCVCQCVAYRGV